jgi:hypothetical protein
MKIFGLGLSRTGTKSMASALDTLGYRIIHYPKDRNTYQEMSSKGDCRFSLLDLCDGLADITTIPFYQCLDRTYPGSKFILTHRNKVEWLASVENHFRKNPLSRHIPDILTERKIRRFLRIAVYGSITFNHELFSRIYDSHIASVQDYFSDRPRQLLTMNILEGEGWKKLCPFLNVPIPSIPFPRI